MFAAVSMTRAAWTADIDGKWTAQVPGRDGSTREQIFTFKVEGDKLTGTTSGMRGDNPISDGKISGDEISFTVKISFNDREITFLYKGKISGDELKLTRSVEGMDRPPQEITAKKVK
jgi:hypothetical protein